MRLLMALLTFTAATLPATTSLGQEPQPPTPAAPVVSTAQGVPVTTATAPGESGAGAPIAAPAPYALPVRFAAGPTERFSTPMMATGIAVTALGTIGTVVGSVLVGYGGTACPNQDGDCLPDQNLAYGLGVIWLSAGSIVAGAGISLWVVGGHEEPAIARAVPSVRLGLTSAEIQWVF